MAWKSFLIIIIGSFLLAACTAVSTPTPAPEAATEPSATTAPATSSPTENAPPEASPTSTPESSTATNPENIPQGGTLVRLYTDPPTLEPHLTTDASSSGLVQEIFGGLVTLNLEYEPVPDLAERWDISDDRLVYTFHLRQDAKFHNGKPVTAQDVKWSLERVTDPETQAPVAEQYLGDIVGVSEKLRGDSDSIRGVRVID